MNEGKNHYCTNQDIIQPTNVSSGYQCRSHFDEL